MTDHKTTSMHTHKVILNPDDCFPVLLELFTPVPNIYFDCWSLKNVQRSRERNALHLFLIHGTFTFISIEDSKRRQQGKLSREPESSPPYLEARERQHAAKSMNYGLLLFHRLKHVYHTFLSCLELHSIPWHEKCPGIYFYEQKSHK